MNVKSQESARNEKFGKANQILKWAREAVNTNNLDIRSVSLKRLNETSSVVTTETDGIEKPNAESDPLANSQRETSDDISYLFPDKVRISNKTQNANGSVDRISFRLTILNEDILETEDKIIAGGKEFSFDSIIKSGPFSSLMPKSKESSMAEKRESFLQNFWLTIFPILLDSPWGESHTFEYVGKAESPDGRADIIDVKSNDVSDTVKIQLFFDEDSHLLLMMTVIDNKEKEGMKVFSDTKYFFSNYERVDGFLIAKKINIESQSKTKMDKRIMGYKLKGGNIKTTSEITLEEVKINPTFKPDTFLIKDEKKK